MDFMSYYADLRTLFVREVVFPCRCISVVPECTVPYGLGKSVPTFREVLCDCQGLQA